MKDYAEINCVRCCKLFKPYSYNNKYCSPKCSSAVNNDRVNKTPKESKLARFDIFQRDGFRCCYCGRSSFEDGVKLSIEHIYPKEKGGSNNPYNLITACSGCNLQKGERIYPKDLMLKLWERNENFNRSYKFKFEDMERIFNEHYAKGEN